MSFPASFDIAMLKEFADRTQRARRIVLQANELAAKLNAVDPRLVSVLTTSLGGAMPLGGRIPQTEWEWVDWLGDRILTGPVLKTLRDGGAFEELLNLAIDIKKQLSQRSNYEEAYDHLVKIDTPPTDAAREDAQRQISEIDRSLEGSVPRVSEFVSLIPELEELSEVEASFEDLAAKAESGLNKLRSTEDLDGLDALSDELVFSHNLRVSISHARNLVGPAHIALQALRYQKPNEWNNAEEAQLFDELVETISELAEKLESARGLVPENQEIVEHIETAVPILRQSWTTFVGSFAGAAAGQVSSLWAAYTAGFIAGVLHDTFSDGPPCMT